MGPYESRNIHVSDRYSKGDRLDAVMSISLVTVAYENTALSLSSCSTTIDYPIDAPIDHEPTMNSMLILFVFPSQKYSESFLDIIPAVIQFVLANQNVFIVQPTVGRSLKRHLRA